MITLKSFAIVGLVAFGVSIAQAEPVVSGYIDGEITYSFQTDVGNPLYPIGTSIRVDFSYDIGAAPECNFAPSVNQCYYYEDGDSKWLVTSVRVGRDSYSTLPHENSSDQLVVVGDAQDFFRLTQHSRYENSLGGLDFLQFYDLNVTGISSYSDDFIVGLDPPYSLHADIPQGGPLHAYGIFEMVFRIRNPATNESLESQSMLITFDVIAIHANVQPRPVTIDIRPISDQNRIRPGSRQQIPVAVLTDDTFDALTIDPTTVRFGPAGATESHGRGHAWDADDDGDMDLLLHFKAYETGIVCGDMEATVTGTTFGGESIAGTDSIVTVGCR